MSKIETVRGLSDSPRAREQDQAMQAMIGLQRSLADLSDLSREAVTGLTDTMTNAGAVIKQAGRDSDTAARKQQTLQNNTNKIAMRMDRMLKQMQAENEAQRTENETIRAENLRLRSEANTYLLRGLIVGALGASVIICATIWLTS